ncbi:LCP family protein [Thermaerobacter composti]|uniref:LCP family protein n=1 Tax=Thermaerobacter composti TaxID=554949 RepID=A0ABZ0QQX4_9FIRM|nr:LCP family protein [Thermaerobacter composti]WPD19669.1 LCP family protein [Thermaerobacter composti]
MIPIPGARKHRPSPIRRLLRVLSWVAALGLLGTAVAIAYLFGFIGTPATTLNGGGIKPTTGKLAPSHRINILLLGIDAREQGEQTRSDTIILVSIDPRTKDVSMLSIPRDSRVKIPGRGVDKINHAHAYGGIELAMRTVADNFGVPVHHWARIDMPGFLRLVDVLGPVTVHVPYDLRLRDGRHLEAGPHQMDSKLALAYLRERYNDRSGDFGRADRQQQFLIDVARQMKSNVSLLDVPKSLSIVIRYVETDMGIRDAVALARLAWGTDLEGVKRGMVKGRGVMIKGVYYYEIDWEETEKVLADLGIKPKADHQAATGASKSR